MSEFLLPTLIPAVRMWVGSCLLACRLDAAGLNWIAARPVPDEGLGRAINDRLRRAAALGS